ncbi:MAG TPA: creatininase family protein [Gemmatimonadales bacterium]|nr:creatininase family protein [Gemmatimonadales bacterium]HTR20716.1 creatininase family protein [Gemmatimonadales bacterium]
MIRILVPAGLLMATGTATVASAQREPGEQRGLTSLYVEDLTWPEVRDAIKGGRSTALIYAGSTEQNGPHMAIGKHTFIAHYVAGRIAQELGDALVYPTLPFAPTGDVAARTGHMRFPGSVSLTGQTFEAVVREVALSAVAAGFHEVYLMGDHGGGQDELRHAAASVQAAVRSRGIRVAYLGDLYYKETEQANGYLRSHGIPIGAHAGAHDTGELMAIDSSGRWIRRDKLAPSDSAHFAETGVDGDPTRATPELGQVFLGYKIQDAVAEIRSLRAKPLSRP